jgi:hypothetical protein
MKVWYAKDYFSCGIVFKNFFGGKFVARMELSGVISRRTNFTWKELFMEEFFVGGFSGFI